MNRGVLVVLALVFAGAGLFFGLRTVDADGVGCGSVFQPSDSAAELEDSAEEVAGTLEGATADEDTTNNQDACSSAREDAKPLAYGGLGLGAVALIVMLAAPGGSAGPGGKPGWWR